MASKRPLRPEVESVVRVVFQIEIDEQVMIIGEALKTGSFYEKEMVASKQPRRPEVE